MITVVSRPQGHKLTEQELSGAVSNSGGQALVTTLFAHGLTDGQYIYIQSNIESYNGFKVVDSTAYNSFTIGDFKQNADIIYRISVLDHGWQCVHLPIVYELESDKYPTNVEEEAYTPNTVVSQSDSEGYTQINLSAALRDPTELSWVKIGDEVYQIVTVIQPWSVVINLAYDVGNSFGPVVTYFKNYCINVNIYAGLPAGHRWEAEKPYELAATLQLIPDVNNQVKFSINEILRGYINVRNNLTLDTLPNNLDFMVAFKIGYFESYDESDGDELSTFRGTETEDDFEGYAVNAKLPFKEGSFLSEYINEDTYLAKWLTIQEHPIAIVGRFFDMSFLLIYSGVDVQIKENGIVVQTIVNPGLGVIRVPLDFSTAGEKCIQAVTSGSAGGTGETSAITLPSLSSGVNVGTGTSWTLGANPSVSLTATGVLQAVQSKRWAQSYAFTPGYTYEFTPNVDYNNDSIVSFLRFQILDASNNILVEESVSLPAGTGSETGPISILAPLGAVKYAYFFEFVNGSGTNTNQVDIDSLTATETTPDTPSVPAQDLTEILCVQVLEECEGTLINVDGIRLLEDGDYRLLE